MNKILSLDLGNVWVGSALSDGLGLTCKPYKTVKLPELHDFINLALKEERVTTVVVGHPVTVSGKKSAQTLEVEQIANQLREKFKEVDGEPITWVLWDERFSTKRAAERTQKRDARSRREESSREHSIAAAFILQSYLDSRAFHDL